MSRKNLRKMLQAKIEFNPFNDNFNYDELAPILATTSNDYDASIASKTPVFNLYFNEFYGRLKKMVSDHETSSEVLMRYFIGIANNDYIALKKAVEDEFKNEQNLEDISSMSVPSSSEHFGEMNAIAAFETIVDILNVVINYLRFFADKTINSNVQESTLISDIIQVYKLSNIYYTIKNVYDTAVWEGGYIQDIMGSLHIKYIDGNYPINKMVGNFRQQKNIFSYFVTLEQMLGQKGSKVLSDTQIFIFRKNLMAKRKLVAIKETSVNFKGVISYTLTTDKSAVQINESMKKGQASIASYYPHLKDVNLPNLNKLTINDLLVLLSQLNELIAGIEDINIDQEVVNPKQLAFRINEANLIKYFLKTTFYSEKDIRAFLSVIAANGMSETRLNLWKSPLIKYRDVYYVCVSAIIAPNFLYLIDEWLEDGGYGIELEERGKLFERFVKITAKEKLGKKGMAFNIPDMNKFYNEKNDYEEIDLIISFDDLLIVAELKNIKYPMEPRDSHNALKRLREGAEQAKRKAGFIVDNKECFVEELGDVSKKKILPLVLTNFSIFSGLNFDEVPVLDLVLLESYIGSGEYTRIKLELSQEQMTTTNMEVVKYYNNYSEFISNFPGYVQSPIPIQELKDKSYVESRVITLEKATPQIYLDVAEFTN